MQAGIVAVPVPLPKPNRSLRWYEHIVQDAQIGCVLGDPALQARLAPAFADSAPLRALPWLAEEQGGHPALAPVAARGDDLVLLQYTSGSTGAPKGVRVSHRNLLANEAMIQSRWGNHAASVIVSWLPHFHDMGLIGKILQSLYVGAELVLMPPAAFIQRPARWLEAISRHRGSNSGAPNFAYEACLRDIDDRQLAALDLSSWQVAWSGAEPVRARTLNAFASRFARCGLRAEALSGSYGLAEATLMVTSAHPCPTPLLRVDAAALQSGRVQVLERAQPGQPGLDCADGDAWLAGCGLRPLDARPPAAHRGPSHRHAARRRRGRRGVVRRRQRLGRLLGTGSGPGQPAGLPCAPGRGCRRRNPLSAHRRFGLHRSGQ